MAEDDLVAGLLAQPTQHSDPVYDTEKKLSVDHDMVADSLENEVDVIHEGMQFPTAEEFLTLRRVSDKIPWNAYLIAVVELAERFSVNFSFVSNHNRSLNMLFSTMALVLFSPTTFSNPFLLSPVQVQVVQMASLVLLAQVNKCLQA
jgi:hypothetical protein